MKKISVFLALSLCMSVVFAQKTRRFKDNRDGKVYKTVKIGNQWWMAENLAYKASSGCWAYGNDESNVSKYGYLYHWNKNVCPNGWHLPSKEEWEELIDFLGGEYVAGKKLKSSNEWLVEDNENLSGNNKSGFNALPGGMGTSKYDCNFVGEVGFWWTSTKYKSTYFITKGMKSSHNKVITSAEEPSFIGCSVRCIKD